MCKPKNAEGCRLPKNKGYGKVRLLRKIGYQGGTATANVVRKKAMQTWRKLRWNTTSRSVAMLTLRDHEDPLALTASTRFSQGRSSAKSDNGLRPQVKHPPIQVKSRAVSSSTGYTTCRLATLTQNCCFKFPSAPLRYRLSNRF